MCDLALFHFSAGQSFKAVPMLNVDSNSNLLGILPWARWLSRGCHIVRQLHNSRSPAPQQLFSISNVLVEIQEQGFSAVLSKLSGGFSISDLLVESQEQGFSAVLSKLCGGFSISDLLVEIQEQDFFTVLFKLSGGLLLSPEAKRR